MRAARDVIGELFSEVRELRSLPARRVSALSAATRNAEQKHSCKGIDCRFSYEYIGEKAGVVGYCVWCDSDKMVKAMENQYLRYRHVEKG